MDKDIKQKYIQLIDTMDNEKPMVAILKDFVNSYDGELTLEFHKLVMGVLVSSMQTDELTAKAEAYDDYEKLRTEQEENMEKLATQGLSTSDMIDVPIPT